MKKPRIIGHLLHIFGCSLMLVYAESRMQDKEERMPHVIKHMEKAGNEMDIVAYYNT